MKYSNHFINDVLPKRPYLTESLLSDILDQKLRIELQENGRMKIWGYSSEYEKYVRVVLMEDGETIHTAFFDRNFKI